MKKHLSLLLLATITTLFYSCKQQPNENNSTIATVECASLTVERFESFLGMSFSDKKDIVGELYKIPSDIRVEDNYTLMDYNDVKGVPLTIYINRKSNEIETILIEILGKGQAFNGDIRRAAKQYNLSSCDTDLFGKTSDEIKSQMGEPFNFGSEETYSFLQYKSTDKSIEVMFKFYFEQESKCSSVEVNWYY